MLISLGDMFQNGNGVSDLHTFVNRLLKIELIGIVEKSLI